jgi:hypothetical protein
MMMMKKTKRASSARPSQGAIAGPELRGHVAPHHGDRFDFDGKRAGLRVGQRQAHPRHLARLHVERILEVALLIECHQQQ